MIRSSLIFSILMLLFGPLMASDVSFTASAPSQVAVGERFRLTYSLNARPDSFLPPEMESVQIVAGPSQSSSSSTQIINNKVTTSVSFSYTYIVQAAKEGKITIGPASATIDGKTYKSNQLEIEVSGESSSGSSPVASPADRSTSVVEASEKDIFIRAHVSNHNPYQSEQVIVSYKIYTRIPVNQYSIERLPSYQGFWSENLNSQDQGSTSVEVIDGISYRVAEIRKVALFPQHSGEISVEPLEVQALVRIPRQNRRESFFDDFFGGSFFDSFQNVEQTLESNPVRLKVQPLPEENKPQAFEGLVGNFDIKASLDTDELAANDAVNLTITIKGNGNLRMLEIPDIDFPQNLETFDPNIKDNITNGPSGVSGSRTINYTLIPRTGGVYEIPGIELVYFDPVKKAYQTRKTDSFTLQVSGNELSEGYLGQEPVRNFTSDIRFIETGPFSLEPVGSLFYRSNLFYFLLILPILIFSGSLIYLRHKVRLQADKAMLRNRKAEKISRRRLRKAHEFLKANDKEHFYDEISRSLWGYISDKLNIPNSRLNREEINKVFMEKNIEPHLSSSFLAALEDCEFARFAPGNHDSLMEEVYNKSKNTIFSLERELRNKS